ncbi:MAG: DoxX family protein [Acidobacteria bacterium]|nr:DoxX family protein [Acidobacteriota bacterium]
METDGLIDRTTRRISTILERLSFIAPLVTRLTLGLAFVQAGQGKWRHFGDTVDYFGALGIPLPAANAAFIASLELVGGAFLLAGLLTRLMSAGLISTMVVALMTAERSSFLGSWLPSGQLSPTDVTAYTFLVLLLWLLFFGAGKVSLDALVFRKAPVGSRSAA